MKLLRPLQNDIENDCFPFTVVFGIYLIGLATGISLGLTFAS